MINGKRYGWEDITVTLPYGIAIDIDSISYGDKKDTEAVYGKGSNPVGYSEGNYSAEGKMTLAKEEFDKLNLYARMDGGSIYRIKPFTTSVSYANEDEPTTTDVLNKCKITAVSAEQKQGDKGIKREVSFIILEPIIWNAQDANPDSSDPVGDVVSGATVASNLT